MADPSEGDQVAQVHPLLRPYVWVAAAVWLPIRQLGRLFVGFLTGYQRAADAVGRGLARAARAVGRAAVRAFRPLGRVFALVARLWHRVAIWAMAFLLRPVGRWLQSAFERVEPAARRFVRAVDRGLRRAGRALAPFAAVIADAARRIAGPAARALRRLSAAVRRSARSLAAAVRRLLQRAS